MKLDRKPFKKPRKKRILTEEQKQVLRDRINKARENRKVSGDKTIHEDIRNLPDDHPLSPKKVIGWIKTCKDKLSGMRKWRTSNDAKQRDTFNIENYFYPEIFFILNKKPYSTLSQNF